MIELKKDGKLFKIPVYWEMIDFVDIYADNLEEAYNYVSDNAEDISLGTDAEYIDGSYEVGSWEETLLFNEEEE